MMRTALGIVLPENSEISEFSENSELSPWPKIKRLVSFWWDKIIFPSVTFSMQYKCYIHT